MAMKIDETLRADDKARILVVVGAAHAWRGGMPAVLRDEYRRSVPGLLLTAKEYAHAPGIGQQIGQYQQAVETAGLAGRRFLAALPKTELFSGLMNVVPSPATAQALKGALGLWERSSALLSAGLQAARVRASQGNAAVLREIAGRPRG